MFNLVNEAFAYVGRQRCFTVNIVSTPIVENCVYFSYLKHTMHSLFNTL
jgi:hypothetical protein